MLNACPSPPHRAALGLVAVALGAPVDEGLTDDIAASDPVVLARLLNLGHVHTLLVGARGRDTDLDAALPEDLWLYLDEMHRANILRQEEALSQLEEIGALLDREGLSLVALKGAAELLSPLYPARGQRFLSDLDLLVREADADHLRAVLSDHGATWHDYPATTAKVSHHLPPVEHPDWSHMVELHIRVGPSQTNDLLPADRVFDTSQPSAIPAIQTPDPRDRYLHHVLHAMQRRFERHDIYLRDIVDHHVYATSLSPEIRASAETALDQAGLRRWLKALDALTAGLLSRTGDTADSAARAWVGEALFLYGSPQRRKRHDTVEWLGHYVRKFLFERDFRRHYIQKALSVKGRREFIAFHRERNHRIR